MMLTHLSRAHFSGRGYGEVGVSTRRRGAVPAAGGHISDGTRLVTADLAPAAQDLLAAAQRILERDGYEALTYRRIAAEAGRNQALISYYFGDRAGLVTLLVDWLNLDLYLDMERTLEAAPLGPVAVTEALLDAHLDLARDRDGSRLWLELVPNVVADSRIRPRVARVYGSYRQLAARADPVMAPLTDMLIAIVDGMAAQYVLGGPGFNGDGAYALLRRLSLGWLARKADAGEMQCRSPLTPPSRPADAAEQSSSRLRRAALPPVDPSTRLSPSARRVLRSAYKVVKSGSLQSLTMGSAAGGSGQSTTNVTYHFGSKAELLAALARLADYSQWANWSGWADETRSAETSASVAQLEQRLRRNLGHMRAFYNLIPVALRDPALSADYADTFAAIRSLIADRIADEGGRDGIHATHLATLAVAVTYGLALQLLLDRGGIFVATSLATWGEIVREELAGSAPAQCDAPSL
jgi:AcrR family transcriptional regulator